MNIFTKILFAWNHNWESKITLKWKVSDESQKSFREVYKIKKHLERQLNLFNSVEVITTIFAVLLFGFY